MAWRFAERYALLDERTEDFLKTLTLLGGYCTAAQARRMGIARSHTRLLAHLKGLEKAGFLRRVTEYPITYQVTKSVIRLLGRDTRVRRHHTVETVRARLLAVNFYLEAVRWPAEFIFPHARKVAAFVEQGFPLDALPKQAGKPYLCEDFVLKLKDGQLCVALVDQVHRSPFMQLWRLGKRFLPCLEYSHERVWLLVAVGDWTRFHYYRRIIARHTFQKLAKGRFTIPVKLYRVQRPIQRLRSLRPRGNDPLTSENHEPESYGSDWHGFAIRHDEL